MLSWLLLTPLYANLYHQTTKLIEVGELSRKLEQNAAEERKKLHAIYASIHAAQEAQTILRRELYDEQRPSAGTAVFRGEARVRLMERLRNKLGADAQCPITYTPVMDNPVVLLCGHVLHRTGWDHWRLVDPRARCPLCRREGVYALNNDCGRWEIDTI